MLVLIPTKLSTVAKELLEEGGYDVVQNTEASLVELVKEHSNADAMIVRSEKITPEILDLLPQLKVIVRAGAGYNTIDTKYARSKGVAVMNTPGANSNAVAEEVIGLMLAGCRNFLPADASTRSGLWEKAKFMGTELTGKTVGILGFGNIGQLLARRLKGFDTDILIYDPYVSQDKARDFGVTLATKEEIFDKADFISLHMPATPETDKIINHDLLSRLKSGAVLVNGARAEILDEDALREVKKDKKIIFCNDVYMKDAAGEKSCADIADIMLPHLGASSIEANTNAARMAGNQVIGYLERGISKFVVNKSVPDGLNQQYQELAFTLGKMARNYLGTEVSPFEIQCSFYGNLSEFSKWLVPAVVAGMSHNKGLIDSGTAEAYLEEKGIELKIREADDSKNYGDSITVDLIQGTQELKRVSVRGTLAEGNLIISRIAGFEKLYFEPSGHSVIFVYQDRPGVLAQITQTLASEGVNIDDIRSPHNAKGNESIAVLKVNKAVHTDVIEKVKAQLACEVGFHFQA
jgi:D-3-phosphoglycerate dehydrogenase / 2-oxoglutarate reductase